LTAFNRLSETAKAEFLADNPDSRLNPNHPQNIRDPRTAPGINFANRPPAPPGTMAYQQWYWDTLIRGQAGQEQMQYNQVGNEQMYQDQGMGMGQDQYNGGMPPYNGQIPPGNNGQVPAGYNGQIPAGFTTPMQMAPGYNNGPLPPLPNNAADESVRNRSIRSANGSTSAQYEHEHDGVSGEVGFIEND
jgi:hypothetical protein